MKLKEKDALLKKKIPLETLLIEEGEAKFGHVYFLIDQEEIVYVGCSVNYRSRIPVHVRGAGWKKEPKKFTHFSLIKVPMHSLYQVELFYIYKYRPKYNKQFLPKSLPAIFQATYGSA